MMTKRQLIIDVGYTVIVYLFGLAGGFALAVILIHG